MSRKHGDGNGLQCPSCESQALRTLETRRHRKTNCRRRECHSCDFRFWTIEIMADRDGNIAEMTHPENY